MKGGIAIEPITLSNSKLKTWRYCTQAFEYKYGQNLERKVKSVPLYRGSIIHEMIENFHKDGNWEGVWREAKRAYDNLFDEEKEMYGDMPMETRRLVKGYIKHWQGDQLNSLLVEEELGPYEINDGIFLKGRIDRIVEDSSGLQWIFDTKTHKRFPEENQRMMNPQAVFYVWLARQAGYNPVGVIWDYVRTKAPSVPQLLKSGELSKRKNIDTTRAIYLSEIKKHGLDPSDYRETLASLRGKEDLFYQRIRQPVSATAMRIMLNDAVEEGKRIRALRANPIRQLGWTCHTCDYFRVCSAELYGLDSDFIRRRDYQIRPPREENDEYTEEE